MWKIWVKKGMQEWNEIDSALMKYLQNVIKKTTTAQSHYNSFS
jgi:hypothetical protein